MDYFALLGIAVGLSMDAFAVSVTNGAVTKNLRPPFALKLAVSFGLFQAVMPMAGWLIGKAGESIISNVDHWIALILLCFLGIQMLREAKNGEEEIISQEGLSWKRVFALGVATSIDALATGVILPGAVGAGTAINMLLAVGIIGTVTFLLSFIGVYVGKRFGALLSNKAQIVGGLVLCFIGIKIFVEHMWFS